MTRRCWFFCFMRQLALSVFCAGFASAQSPAPEIADLPSGSSKTASRSGQALQGEKSADEAGAGETVGAAPSNLQVFLPPVLEKNKPCWGSVYDLNGAQSASQRFLLNETELFSDDYGSLHFLVPELDTLVLKAVSSTGKILWQCKYSSTAQGLLVSDEQSSEIVDKLDSLYSAGLDEPVISFAPSVVESLQTITILGKNFSGRQGDNEVEIDNRDSDILAASPRSIVAVTNEHLKIGPIKELRVSSGNLSSLPTELDVAGADLKLVPAASGKKKLLLKILGSTLPITVALSNNSESNMRFGGWRLGAQNIFLSPGGQENSLAVDTDSMMKAEDLHAILLSNGLFDPYSLKTNRSLLSGSVQDAEESAEYIRLKKREFALEAQQANLQKEKASLEKNGKLSSLEDAKIESASRAIAARLYRIEKMLKARRLVLESSAAQDLTKLSDAASGNVLSSLEGVLSCKDLGFSESRLLKVMAKRQEEQAKQASVSTMAYIPQYTAPPAAFLQSYRKKWGKKGYVPPPPQAPMLIPPPPAFQPDPGSIGPYLGDIKAKVPQSMSRLHKKKQARETTGKSGAKKKSFSSGTKQKRP